MLLTYLIHTVERAHIYDGKLEITGLVRYYRNSPRTAIKEACTYLYLIRYNSAWAKLRADLVGSDRVKVTKSKRDDRTLMAHLLQDLERVQVSLVTVILPMELHGHVR